MRNSGSPKHGLVRELQRSHRAVVVTLCAMLLLSVASSGYLLLVVQPRLEHYTELTRDARLMHQAMLEQEASAHGWLATGDGEFLERYETSGAIADDLSELMLQTSTISDRITINLVPVLLARQEWERWEDRAAAFEVTPADRTSGRLTALLDVGKRHFTEYEAAEQISTDYIVSQRDEAVSQQRAALVAALLATLLLLAGSGVLAARRDRRLQRSVVAPLTLLLATIRSLREGDLSSRSQPSGVAELDAVGAALSVFADDLLTAKEVAVAREARLALLAERLETVIRVARETSGSLNVRYVGEAVASAAADLLGAPTVLWIRNDDGDFRAARRSMDGHGVVPPSELLASSLVALAAADARTCRDEVAAAFPLVQGGLVVGVLEAATTSEDADSEHVLEALLSTAAAALESARLHSSAREMAEIDALTHLPNRRRMERDLETEWDRCSRYGRPLTFAMLDLDHFKRLNDTHGHLVGDRVLSAASAAIDACLRGTDTAYRYGGEEIGVLLRETEINEAMIVAERLRRAVASVLVEGSTAVVTASIGVAQGTSAMLGFAEMVALADEALYEAKRGGRNRVSASAATALRV